MRTAWLRPVTAFALSLALAGAGSSQRGKSTSATTPSTASNTSSQPLVVQDTEPFPEPGGQDDTPDAIRAGQQRLRVAEREKHLTADTARLVELSQQLQSHVSHDGKNVLSLDDIRRTEEIERLARKVRDRLKS